MGRQNQQVAYHREKTWRQRRRDSRILLCYLGFSGLCSWTAQYAKVPGHPKPQLLPRQSDALRSMGLGLRSAREKDWYHRHRSHRRPNRARSCQVMRTACSLPENANMGDPTPRPSHQSAQTINIQVYTHHPKAIQSPLDEDSGKLLRRRI